MDACPVMKREKCHNASAISGHVTGLKNRHVTGLKNRRGPRSDTFILQIWFKEYFLQVLSIDGGIPFLIFCTSVNKYYILIAKVNIVRGCYLTFSNYSLSDRSTLNCLMHAKNSDVSSKFICVWLKPSISIACHWGTGIPMHSDQNHLNVTLSANIDNGIIMLCGHCSKGRDRGDFLP